MILSRQSKPLKRSWIRPKKRTYKPGGEWIFDYAGKHYELPGKFVQDPTSPSDDGMRWIAAPESKMSIRILTHAIANGQCELKKDEHCWKWAPVDRGHPHHTRHCKMGGAFTDDRIWLIVQGEQVQIRAWTCLNCHREHHNPLHWSKA